MQNKEYARLVDDSLEYLDLPIISEDKLIYTSDPDILKEYGYKEVIDDPSDGDLISYTETADTIEIHKSRSLEFAKNRKLEEIKVYDKSPAVDSFTIHGIEVWFRKEFDRDTRNDLERAVIKWKSKGYDTYDLCIEGVGVLTLGVDEIISILSEIELYAIECFKVTFLHKEQVLSFDNLEDIDNFDITADYPEKLVFS